MTGRLCRHGCITQKTYDYIEHFHEIFNRKKYVRKEEKNNFCTDPLLEMI